MEQCALVWNTQRSVLGFSCIPYIYRELLYNIKRGKMTWTFEKRYHGPSAILVYMPKSCESGPYKWPSVHNVDCVVRIYRPHPVFHIYFVHMPEFLKGQKGRFSADLSFTADLEESVWFSGLWDCLGDSAIDGNHLHRRTEFGITLFCSLLACLVGCRDSPLFQAVIWGGLWIAPMTVSDGVQWAPGFPNRHLLWCLLFAWDSHVALYCGACSQQRPS